MKKYVLITGSSSGIGKETAFYCARKGMNVLLTALPETGLQEVNDTIKSLFPVDSGFFEADLTAPDGPERVRNWVEENKYEVYFLINNAGLAGTSVFEESTPDYNDQRILLNIRAVVLLTHLFLPLLKKHEKSFILNTGSLSAFYSIPYKSIYSASKTFVLNFSRALRTELRKSGVSISVVCPNGVRTNAGTHARIDAHGLKGKLTSVSVEKVAEFSVEKTLKGKFLIIPGFLNYILLAFSRIIPEFLQQRILQREFEKEVRVSKPGSG